ncbi:MAG: polymerase [Treponema sp.]|nr:polymerase [Treponema sp.]
MYRTTVFLLIFLVSAGVFAQDIKGSIEWDKLRFNAEVSLDLASAGLRLPSGRTQAESLLRDAYIKLINKHLFELQVDSSSTIGDLVNRGELSTDDAENIAQGANSIAPALSSDLRKISASHTISLANISSALLRHSRPTPVIRTLNPVSTARYTGIIIIANEKLPIHGMRSTTLPVPCLFPKIWDSDMNIIYEKSMLETRNAVMANYFSPVNIFHSSPSGLSPELQQITGERPLRIFAQGVFGIKPTDFIIDRGDALLIISSEDNRRLLSQGKVVFIMDESVLRYSFPDQ